MRQKTLHAAEGSCYTTKWFLGAQHPTCLQSCSRFDETRQICSGGVAVAATRRSSSPDGREGNLDDLQDRLHQRFSRLATTRSSRDERYRIFALEHGLSPQEVSQLQDKIRCHPKGELFLERHWLPWIVYAAELGYRYCGHEYWQTFEDETPDWGLYGDRDAIRMWFRRFAKQYHGAEPTGRWASHFSIICWPITHAILPKDLQRQLVRVLYETRDLLTTEEVAEPELLGQRVAAMSWGTSSRFKTFAEQHRLLGQIANALLFGGEGSGNEYIESGALARIVQDLTEERHAKSWLAQARNSAALLERRGIQAGPGEGRPRRSSVTYGDLAVFPPPTFYLRPMEGDAWQVVLELPDISPLTDRQPDVREFLEESRAKVSGAEDRWLARGRLLYGRQSVILQKWPDFARPLVAFDKPVPAEAAFLDDVYSLNRVRTRVFRVCSDGVAREVRSRNVRSGRQYVLLSEDALPCDDDMLCKTRVECEGISASLFDVPEDADELLGRRLAEYGVHLGRYIAAEPVGVLPQAWDGEGHGHWLCTDKPVLSLSTNLGVVAFRLRLQTRPVESIDVPCRGAGYQHFVQLPPMAPGSYSLALSIRRQDASDFEDAGSLTVHTCRPDVARTQFRGAMFTVLDPPSASLDELWSGAAQLSIYGPPTRSVVPTVELRDDRGELLDGHVLPKLCLPVEATTWAGHFRQHFRQRSSAQRTFDAAFECRISLEGESLGKAEFSCERRLQPIRWLVYANQGQARVRLLNLSECQPEATCFRLAKPDRESCLRLPTEGDDFVRCEEPALLRAQCGKDQDLVVLVPKGSGLDLGSSVHVTVPTPAVREIDRLLRTLELWSSARLPGSTLAAVCRYTAIKEFHSALTQSLCGRGWLDRERAADDEAETKEYTTFLREAAGMPPEGRDFLRVMKSECHLLALDSPTERSWHVAFYLEHVWHFSEPRWLAEFALRLASSPESIRSWAGGKLSAGLKQVGKHPYILRTCRLVVLGVDKVLGGRQESLYRVPIYGGWDW